MQKKEDLCFVPNSKLKNHQYPELIDIVHGQYGKTATSIPFADKIKNLGGPRLRHYNIEAL